MSRKVQKKINKLQADEVCDHLLLNYLHLP